VANKLTPEQVILNSIKKKNNSLMYEFEEVLDRLVDFNSDYEDVRKELIDKYLDISIYLDEIIKR